MSIRKAVKTTYRASHLMVTLTLTLAFLASALGTSPVKAATIWYVDASNTWPTTDDTYGRSWANAFPDFTEAFTSAGPGDQIWVAAGTYTNILSYEVSRSDALVMESGLEIYGGFDPADPAQIDPSKRTFTSASVLSGDNNETAGDITDDAFHVVKYTNIAEQNQQPNILDGFTIELANANDAAAADSSGAGMVIDNSTVTLRNIIFVNNTATVAGAGLLITNGSSVTLDNVTFQTNSASNGAGLYVDNSNVTILNSTFTQNAASNNGGGAYIKGGTVSLSKSTFDGNTAYLSGGGLYVDAGNPSIDTVVFKNNIAEGANDSGAPTSTGGGLAFNTGSTSTIKSSTFETNTASANGGGLANPTGNTLTLDTVVFNSNYANAGAGLMNQGTMTVKASTFDNNTTAFSGAGILNYGNLTVSGSTFNANTSSQDSSGIYSGTETSSLLVTNSTFYANSSNNGGTIVNYLGAAKVTNSTFYLNAVYTFDGAADVKTDGGTFELHNTLLADASQGQHCYGGITDGGGNVQNQDDGSCPGTIPVVDPMLNTFGNYGGATLMLPLQYGSGAIDAGTEPCPSPDQRGAPRPSGASCDSGAYEVQLPQLAVTKTVTTSAPYAEGDVLGFSITVENVDTGHADPAHGVVVEDTLPATLLLDQSSIDASIGTAFTDPNYIKVDGFDLNPGEKLTLTFTATALNSGNPITNEASVTCAEIATPVKSSVSPTVDNVPPTVTIDSFTDNIKEGASTTVTASFTDLAADGDQPFTYSFNWGDGSAATTGVMTNVGSLPSTTHRYTDNGSYPVVLTVTDKDGGASTANFTVTVTNVVPTVTIDTFDIPAEGGSVTFTGRFTDPAGSRDVNYAYTWTLDGQVVGSGTVSSYGNPATVPAYTHAFPVGSHTIQLSITDKDGGKGESSSPFTVSNTLPAVDLGSAQTITEGSSVDLEAVITDPGQPVGETYTTAWNFGDGQTQAESSATKTTHTYVDEGTGSFTVTATVKDSNNGSQGGTVTINVSNVDPTVTIVSMPTLKEGESGTFQAHFTDPGTADTFAYEWDWGDGEKTTGKATAPTSVNADHVYAQSGRYDGKITVTDNDGGIDISVFHIIVANVAPTITNVTLPPAMDEGGLYGFSATFTDPAGDLDASYLAKWTWGDATPDTDLTGIAYGSTISTQHTYNQNGTYTVSLTVTDKDGGASTVYTHQVSVSNVAPVASPSVNPTSGDEGQELSFTGGFTDPGADTHTFLWTFGDGSTSTAQNPKHTFADNRPSDAAYTVSFKVTDQDGAADTRTLSVVVHNVAPTATIVLPASINEAQEVTFGSNVTDPGINDTFTYEWTIDGALQSAATPTITHTFANSGKYTIVLKVTDKDGASVTDTAKDLVVTDVAPSIQTVLNKVGFAGLPMDFTATFTDPALALDNPYSATWSWDDGSPDTVMTDVTYGTALTASHTFPDKGPYHVTLTVMDQDSLSGVANIVVVLDKNFLYIPLVSLK